MTVIEEYIATCPIEHHERLNSLYYAIKEILPYAQEKLSYQMPTFWQGENIVHFALCKNHIGFYPTPSAINHFSNRLTTYKHSKGAIQFQHKKILPLEFISEIVKYRKNQIY